VKIARTNARAGVGVDAVTSFLSEVTVRAPGGPQLSVRNVPEGVPLPMMDAFAARRRHVGEVVEEAGFVAPGPSALSERLDSLFLHRLWGPLVFLAVVLLVFQSIFTWAVPLMDGVEFVIASSGEWLAATLPESWFRSLLIDGVWAGVGSVCWCSFHRSSSCFFSSVFWRTQATWPGQPSSPTG
jgi:ferrous iron transport protein B